MANGLVAKREKGRERGKERIENAFVSLSFKCVDIKVLLHAECT